MCAINIPFVYACTAGQNTAVERALFAQMSSKIFGPQIDGEIIPRDIQVSFEDGQFTPRPLIAMANTDEGEFEREAVRNPSTF